MKIGKIINGELNIVEIENGIEITENKNKRAENDLYTDGYKKVCFIERPSKNASMRWIEYPTCFVQDWIEEDNETNEIY